MSAGAVNLGGLISTFHFGNPRGVNDSPQILKKVGSSLFLTQQCQGEPVIIANFLVSDKFSPNLPFRRATRSRWSAQLQLVDNGLINYNSGRDNLQLSTEIIKK